MVAVDPTRVIKGFNADSLGQLVTSIDEMAGGLLQIVNYNVDPSQLVVAGDLTSLTALMHACNKLKSTKEEPVMGNIVSEAVDQARKDLAGSSGYLQLKRGGATIPLEGIDVPFHSRFLPSGVSFFRSVLKANMQK